MLVGAYDGAIQKRLFKVRILGQFCKYLPPDPVLRPARKARIYAVPTSELSGQIAPRAARTGNPQHRFDEQSIILPRAPRIPRFPWQHGLQPLPLVIS